MLRMSFIEHLEELRSRILKALGGIGVAFLVCIFYAERLWMIVSEPATQALLSLGFKEPKLAQLTPMEGFSVIWVKLPDAGFHLHRFALDPLPGLGLHRSRTVQERAALGDAFRRLFGRIVHSRRPVRLFRRFPLRPHLSARNRPGYQYHSPGLDIGIFRSRL